MELKFYFKRLFLGAVVSVFFLPTPGSSKPVVVLDAAHGGNDPGVRAGSEVEKEWNYKFSLSLEKALEGAGFEVVEVRKRDETISLEKRAEIINTTQASAVIVIHADREWTGTKKGPMIVVEPPTQANEFTDIPKWGAITPSRYRSSLKLARAIAGQLGIGSELSSLSDSRGITGETTSSTSRLYCLPHQSLRYVSLPAIVLTPLFLTSSSDVKKFSNGAEMEYFSSKVAQGLADFLQ
ncbi:MAG TPA: N-acetylmuramoyl-L-alanine amidase [bacterium]|nr:N-acetylmuramoyl-L-alanine amidase [bacterium]